MKIDISQALSRCYSTAVVPDITTDGESCYMAYHPDLEGCMSHGSTQEEALSNLLEVTTLYLQSLAKRGLEIPVPLQRPEITWTAITSETRLTETFVVPLPSVTFV